MNSNVAPDAAQSAAPAAPNDADLARAKRRVAAMKAFYIHLAVFTVVLFGLAAIDIATGPPWWVHWVFLGWGVGVAAHGLTVFGRLPQAVADWEERKLKELINEQRAPTGQP